jgi:hypothetical protein
MQATGNKHEQICDAFLGVAQYVFHAARAFHPRERMFDSDPEAGDFSIRALLGLRELTVPRLFFGCCVCTAAGSYP